MTRMEEFLTKMKALLDEYDAGFNFVVDDDFSTVMEIYIDADKPAKPGEDCWYFDDEQNIDPDFINLALKLGEEDDD